MVKYISDIHESLRYSLDTDPSGRTEEEINLGSLIQQCDPIHYRWFWEAFKFKEITGNGRRSAKQLSLFGRKIRSMIWREAFRHFKDTLIVISLPISGIYLHSISYLGVMSARRFVHNTDTMLSRSQQTTVTTQLQDLAKTLRQLEINRTYDLREVTNAMTEGFEALQCSQTKTNTLLRRAKVS